MCGTLKSFNLTYVNVLRSQIYIAHGPVLWNVPRSVQRRTYLGMFTSEQTYVRSFTSEHTEQTIELYIYERTNVPYSSQHTWTLFHQPPDLGTQKILLSILPTFNYINCITSQRKTATPIFLLQMLERIRNTWLCSILLLD